MLIKTIKPNPNNPRLIKDDKFKQLVNSLKSFPKMMELRPIVVDENNMILGGNMRYKALQELGYKKLPDEWVKKASELTEEQKKEFIIKDNVSFGLNDWSMLANEWDTDKLIEWGLDIPDFAVMPDELTGEDKDKPPVMKITFPEPEDLQGCESEIQEVLNRKCPKAFYSVSAGEI